MCIQGEKCAILLLVTVKKRYQDDVLEDIRDPASMIDVPIIHDDG